MTQAQQSASFFLGRGSRSFMEAQWIVDGPLDPVWGKVRSFLAARRMTIVEDGAAEVVATEGSQVRTRAIGGWFVNPESLPKRAAIHLTSSGQNVILDAIVFETLGFGILDPHFDAKHSFQSAWPGQQASLRNSSSLPTCATAACSRRTSF